MCQPGVTAGANGFVVCVWCVGDDRCVNLVSQLGLMVVWCVWCVGDDGCVNPVSQLGLMVLWCVCGV